MRRLEYGVPLSGGKGLVNRRPSGGAEAAGRLFPQGCAPHFLFGSAKKRMRRARWKRKSASAGRSAQARTSCRRRGEGWLSRTAVRDGNALPLGKPLARGGLGYRPAPLFAAAGRWDDSLRNGPMKASAPTTARAARNGCAAVGGPAALWMRRAPCGQAERAEGGTSGTLVTEILGAPQCETVKEELAKCVLTPRRRRHYPPRVGSIDLAEGPSVLEGKAKSAQAPIRRLPSRGGPLHRSASKRFFSLDRARPVSLLARQKRNGGCILAGPAPLREQ